MLRTIHGTVTGHPPICHVTLKNNNVLINQNTFQIDSDAFHRLKQNNIAPSLGKICSISNDEMHLCTESIWKVDSSGSKSIVKFQIILILSISTINSRPSNCVRLPTCCCLLNTLILIFVVAAPYCGNVYLNQSGTQLTFIMYLFILILIIFITFQLCQCFLSSLSWYNGFKVIYIYV